MSRTKTKKGKNTIGVIASRKLSLNASDILDWLPDPDPVLRKLGQDATVLKEIQSDDHITACIGSRRAGVTKNEWILTPASSEKRAQYVFEYIDDVITNQWKMKKILRDILKAPLWGYAPLEVMWAVDGGKWYIENLIGKPADWFVFGAENELLFRSKKNSKGEQVPENKFIVAKYNDEYDNPYGERLLSKCFWPFTFKRNGWKFWMAFLDKYGIPYIVAKYDKMTKEKEVDELLDKLAAMVQDAILAIPGDGSVEIIESKGGNAGAFKSVIESCDLATAKILLGQNLTTEISQGGSYAASQTHMQVRQDIIDEDKELCVETVQEAINMMTFYETGDLKDAPRFSFYESEDLQNERADRDAKLHNQNLRFTKKYYMTNYQLEEDDFEISEEINLFDEETQGGKTDETSEEANNAGKGEKEIFLKMNKKYEKRAEQAVKFKNEIKFNPYNDIISIIDESKNYKDFLTRLNAFAKSDANLKDIEEKLSAAMLTGDYLGIVSVINETKNKLKKRGNKK